MILDVEPVAYLHPVPVHRKLLAVEDLHDHQGDQLLRKLVRTVVVRAVGGRDIESERVVIRPDEVVASRLAGRVG